MCLLCLRESGSSALTLANSVTCDFSLLFELVTQHKIDYPFGKPRRLSNCVL